MYIFELEQRAVEIVLEGLGELQLKVALAPFLEIQKQAHEQNRPNPSSEGERHE